MLKKFIRLPTVVEVTGKSRAGLYALIAEGKFPKPVPLGGTRAVGWVEDEVVAWQEARIAERDAVRKPAA